MVTGYSNECSGEGNGLLLIKDAAGRCGNCGETVLLNVDGRCRGDIFSCRAYSIKFDCLPESRVKDSLGTFLLGNVL